MARFVYFSFHYDLDCFRVNVVRNSQKVKSETQEVGFVDHGLWEKAKKQGDSAITRLIDNGLRGAGVTAVLIGQQTAQRRWVKYEIEESYNDGKGLVGIYIDRIVDGRTGQLGVRGPNPLDAFYIDTPTGRRYLSSIFRTYDWLANSGRENVATWLDEAVRIRRAV